MTHFALARPAQTRSGRFRPGAKFYRARAWSVHLYTSLGLICELLALAALLADDVGQVVGWLGLALFIDATDGTLARRFGVTTWTPTFDGRKLDDITDYISYCLIPVAFAYRFGLVTRVGQLVLPVVLILGAYGFCQAAAKTKDGYFTGFPNFWNIVILYLYVGHLPPTVNALVLLGFAGLVLVPVKCVSRSTRPYQKLTLAVMVAYWVMLVAMGATVEHPVPALIRASLFGPAYYVAISLYLNWTERHRPTGALYG